MLRKARPLPLAMAAGILGVLAVVALAVVHPFAGDSAAPAGRTAPAEDGAFSAFLDSQGFVDTDHDGLSNAAENYITGSDPLAWDTGGSGIPDGWLARFGLDLLD